MSMHTKTIEQITSAPFEVQKAMLDFTFYHDAESELYDDICNKYYSPVLWVALRTLVNYVETKVRAQNTYMHAGFTCDDAIALTAHEDQEYYGEGSGGGHADE